MIRSIILPVLYGAFFGVNILWIKELTKRIEDAEGRVFVMESNYNKLMVEVQELKFEIAMMKQVMKKMEDDIK